MINKTSKILNVVAWVLTILLFLEFLIAGQAKFTTAAIWSNHFMQWGYPDGFYMVVGAVEVLGAIALLIPKTLQYAAALLSIIMLAASITHFVHGENGVMPLVAMILLIVLVYLRRFKLNLKTAA